MEHKGAFLAYPIARLFYHFFLTATLLDDSTFSTSTVNFQDYHGPCNSSMCTSIANLSLIVNLLCARWSSHKHKSYFLGMRQPAGNTSELLQAFLKNRHLILTLTIDA